MGKPRLKNPPNNPMFSAEKKAAPARLARSEHLGKPERFEAIAHFRQDIVTPEKPSTLLSPDIQNRLNLRTALTNELLKAAEGSQNRLEKVVQALLDEAEAGSIEHIKVLFERLEGRPHQSLSVTGEVTHSWASLLHAADKRLNGSTIEGTARVLEESA